MLPHLPAKEFIAPTDSGVSFPEYRDDWALLSPIEKALIYWAEVNAFALRQERELAVPWLRIRHEELFAVDNRELTRLLDFLGIPSEFSQRIDRGERVDEHHFPLTGWPEPERIAQHPGVMALAEALGYRPMDFAPETLAARFFGG